MRAHAAALAASGARVTIVAGRGRKVAGAELVLIPEIDSTHPLVLGDLRDLARGRVTDGHARLVGSLVRSLGPVLRSADRVVVHNVLTMSLSLALAEALAALAKEGREMIAWTHDIAWLDPRCGPERHPGDPWDLIARAAPNVRYVAVSEERARQLAALTGMPRRRVAVVPNGIDLVQRLGLSREGADLSERMGLLEADPLLLLPARLTRRKRVEVAIDALAALRRRHPRAALVVTGSPGPHNINNLEYGAELARRASKVPGAYLLHALGIRPGERLMTDLFAMADVLVLPSESEGFGIPMLEAGSHGVPVVASDLPTLRALAGDDATFVAPTASGAVLARAVERRLSSDPVARLRRRAKQHAWPRLLRERVIPLILDDVP